MQEQEQVQVQVPELVVAACFAGCGSMAAQAQLPGFAECPAQQWAIPVQLPLALLAPLIVRPLLWQQL